MMQVKKKKRRHHSLTGRITMKILKNAFKAVRKNRGAAGVDKVSIRMFESNLEGNLSSLMRKLKTDTYHPIPLRRKFIPKGDGKFRPLGIPAVKCRVAQEVIRCIINPIFERLFHRSSHGYRQNKSCHTALEELFEYYKQGYNVVLEADIRGFFDNISQKLIMAMVTREISDGKTLNTIKKFLQAGVMEDGKFVPTRKGTPQGGNISPLLSNIVLNHLDWTLDKHGYKFIRYADDFIVLTKSLHQAEKAFKVVKHCIEEDLGLQLSEEKTGITTFKQGFEFLGFFISSRTVKMKPKAEKKFRDKIKSNTTRSHNLERTVIVKLNQIIRGTVNYFYQSYTTNLNQFKRLDSWIRKRIRCMKYKRIWHTDNRRLKIKHIRRMGLLFCYDLCVAKEG
jgi:group II intron reverse transcriptase/maturase